MKIKLKKGMNILRENGTTASAKAGAVVNVNDRFGKRVIASGRAESVAQHDSGQKVKDRESGIKNKQSER